MECWNPGTPLLYLSCRLLIQPQQAGGVFAHNFSFSIVIKVVAVDDHLRRTGKFRVPMRIIRGEENPLGADGSDHFPQTLFFGLAGDVTLPAEIVARFHLQPRHLKGKDLVVLVHAPEPVGAASRRRIRERPLVAQEIFPIRLCKSSSGWRASVRWDGKPCG